MNVFMDQCLLIVIYVFFSCTCFILLPKAHRSKLSFKHIMWFFLGYDIRQKGYRSYDPVSGCLLIYQHLIFLEKLSYYKLTPPSHPTHSELVHIDLFLSVLPNDEYICTLDVQELTSAGIRPLIT